MIKYKRIYACDFCGKNQDEVKKLVAGSGTGNDL